MEKIRQEFILEAIQKEKSISKLCREYGISRPTAYKWLERFHNGDTLKDKSHEAKVKPRKTPVEKEELILDTRSKHPTWGPRKLQRFLLDKGYEELPATSTIADILKRNNCIAPEFLKLTLRGKDLKKIILMKCGKWITKGILSCVMVQDVFH